MGIVRAYQKGDLETPPSPEVQGVAASMKKKDVKDFASTKHKGLPEKVSKVSESNGEEEIKKYLENQKSPSDAAEEKIKAYRQKNPRKKGPFAPMDKFKASKSRMKYRQTGPDEIKEDYVKELEDGLVKMDYPTYDEVDELMKKIAKENDIDTTTLHMAFKTKHLMVPDDWAKKKMFEPVMIPKTPENMSCEGLTAKDRFNRDAGKIAKKKIRNKEHRKYVNFLDVDEAVNAAQQAAIAISKKNRLQDLKVAKKRKLKKEDYEPINELSQETMASAAKEAMKKRDNARGTPEYGRRQKQVLKFVAGAVKKRQQRDSVERSFKKPDAERTPTMEGNSIQESPTLVGAVTYKKSEKPGKFEKAGRVVGGIGGSIAGGAAGTAAGGPLGGIGGGIAGDIVGTRAGGDMGQKIDKLTRKPVKEEGLRDWFGKSKSKDGKGGWVNVVTGGTCASDEPGEGTPKCVSSSKRASMTKAERLSAQRRKKAADPGQQSKKNAAKPTYVSTDSPKKKKKMSEGITYINPNNNRNDMGAPKGMKSTTPPKPKEKKLTKPPYENLAAEYAPKGEGLDERLGGKGVSKKAAAGSIYPGKKGDGDYPDSDRGAGNKAMRRSGGKVEAKSPTFLAYLKNKKNKMNEAKKVRRDEYGDIIGGPPISDKQRAKNLAKNEKDEKIVRSEAYSSRPSNVKKKAKLNAALKRLEDMKVASKMKKEEVEQINEFKKSPAWQRKAGKSESGGLNAKGVASYRAANPGSKLKTAVTTKPSKLKKGSKSAKRRLSFCRRMKGMKKKLTSAKTARDPDSRINKALRKWNCSFEPEHGEVISEGKVAKMVKSLRRKTKVLEKGQKKGRDAGAIAAKIMRDKEHNKYVSFLPAPTNEEKEIPANVKKIAKELDKAVAMHKSQAQRLRKAGISEGKKKCGEGEYYCNDMKKCRPIPKGYRVGYGGMLKPENEKDESNGKKGGSNGNGNGHGGNGNGHGGNGNGGNGGGGNGGGE